MFSIFSVDSVWWFYFFNAFRKSEMQNKIFPSKIKWLSESKVRFCRNILLSFCKTEISQAENKIHLVAFIALFPFSTLIWLRWLKCYDIFHLPNMSEIVECFVCALKHNHKFLCMTIKIINLFATCIKFIILKENSWNLVLCEMQELQLSDFHTKQSKQ